MIGGIGLRPKSARQSGRAGVMRIENLMELPAADRTNPRDGEIEIWHLSLEEDSVSIFEMLRRVAVGTHGSGGSRGGMESGGIRRV